MSNKVKVSYIIAFYNNLPALKLILEALEIQSFKEFEVIIADDGSKKEVVAEIEKFQNNCSFPIMHIWHEDDGWRKNIVLNRSIENSTAQYLIFTDGDCIPHPRFIEQHYINKKNATALTGRRQNLSKYITKKLSPKLIRRKFLQRRGRMRCLVLSFFGKGNHYECGIFSRSAYLKKIDNRKSRGILGCNFSTYKKDLLLINGFDERYVNPGTGEDSDPDYRLRLLGFKIESIKYMAVQYHLYHKELPRSSDNEDLFREVQQEALAFTPYGIHKIDAGD